MEKMKTMKCKRIGKIGKIGGNGGNGETEKKWGKSINQGGFEYLFFISTSPSLIEKLFPSCRNFR